MMLCWISYWNEIREYGAYILEKNKKTGEPELRGFGTTSNLAELAAEIKAITRTLPKEEGIALRYEPPGIDFVTLWADDSINLMSIGEDCRALNPKEINQFRKAFLKAK